MLAKGLLTPKELLRAPGLWEYVVGFLFRSISSILTNVIAYLMFSSVIRNAFFNKRTGTWCQILSLNSKKDLESDFYLLFLCKKNFCTNEEVKKWEKPLLA